MLSLHRVFVGLELPFCRERSNGLREPGDYFLISEFHKIIDSQHNTAF